MWQLKRPPPKEKTFRVQRYQDAVILRTWGAAVLHPYMIATRRNDLRRVAGWDFLKRKSFGVTGWGLKNAGR
jgi:hypothetical protein